MGTPARGHADYYEPDDFNAVCSMCGRKEKASRMIRNWQGLYRHTYHNEERQPQDFARGQADNVSTPWAQSPQGVFVQICTFNGISGIPDYALPDCSLPDRVQFDPSIQD